MNLDGLFVAAFAAWLLIDVGFIALRVYVTRGRRRRGWGG